MLIYEGYVHRKKCLRLCCLLAFLQQEKLNLSFSSSYFHQQCWNESEKMTQTLKVNGLLITRELEWTIMQSAESPKSFPEPAEEKSLCTISGIKRFSLEYRAIVFTQSFSVEKSQP